MNSGLHHWKWNRLLGISLLSLYLGKTLHYLQQLLVKDDVEIQIAFSIASLGFIALAFYLFASFRTTVVLVLFLPVYIFLHAVETAFFEEGIKWAYLPEHALQVALPLLLFAHVYFFVTKTTLLKVLLYATALTFLGHGVLALGLFHEVPGNFLGMTSSFFQCSHQTAQILLFIWGIMDLIVIVLLFIPVLRRYALMYMFLWGTVTALARVLAYWNLGLLDAVLYQSGGTVFRLLHGLVPLYLFVNRKDIKL